MIQQSGTPAYVRDGKVYEGGIFGGDIVEAVRGNPEAESHARAYKNQTIGGFLAAVAGGISMVSGAVLISAGALKTESGGSNNTESTTGGVLLAGGLGAYIAGLVLIVTAQPHMWDAINVYNDGVPIGPVPYGYPPPGYFYPPPPPGASQPSSPGAPPAPASSAQPAAR